MTDRQWMLRHANVLATALYREMGHRLHVDVLVSQAYADFTTIADEHTGHTENYMRYVMLVRKSYETLGGSIVETAKGGNELTTDPPQFCPECGHHFTVAEAVRDACPNGCY